MHIRSLRAPAFQGHAISVEFAPLNLIVGDTFSGKTAVVNAMNIGMYGWIPRLKKKGNAFVFRASSDPHELYVGLIFSDDSKNTVVISKDSEGGYSCDEHYAHEFPLVLMDANQYINSTGQEQLSYVLEHSKLDKLFDAQEMLTQVCAPLEGARASASKLLNTWCGIFEDHCKDGETPAAMIDMCMESLTRRQSELKKDIKQYDASVKGFKVLPEVPDVSKQLDKAKTALEQAVQRLSDARSAQRAPNTAVYEVEIRRLRSEIDSGKACIVIRENQAESMRKRKECPTCSASGKNWLNPWLANNKKEIDVIETLLGQYQDQLKEAEKSLKDAQSKSAKSKTVLNAEKAKQEAQEAYDALEVQNLAFRARQDALSALEGTKAKLDTARAEMQVVHSLIARLTDYQSGLASKTFGKLLKVAALFTDGILRSKLEYRDGELGRVEGTHWASHEFFSGTEKMVAFAGLQVALAQESPVKIVVLDDPLGCVPARRKRDIAERMQHLIAQGVVDQVFLVEPSARDYQGMKGLNVIDTDKL